MLTAQELPQDFRCTLWSDRSVRPTRALDNRSATTGIFARRTAGAPGRRLAAIGFRKSDLAFLSLHTQIGLFHFPGTELFLNLVRIHFV